MDSVSVLRVFWRNKWLFSGVFLVIFVIGGVYIAYSARVQQQSNAISAHNNYAFFLMSKAVQKYPNVSSSLFVTHKILNPILNRLLNAPDSIIAESMSQSTIESSASIIQVIKNNLWVLPPANPSIYAPDAYWFIYPAQSAKEAQDIADLLVYFIQSAPEVQAFMEHFRTLATAQSDGVYKTSLEDILQNGAFIHSTPQATNTRGFSEMSIMKESISGRFTTRSKWILLLASAFVLAALSVFVKEFLSTQWRNIKHS
ncbi:hypothetical protein LS71_004195 [Helicobacter jaachi]|uniref:Uncharacterized protein n=1 Tax=Helicobacter jaachi TaxID=1677920 RepID=A0A4U8TAA4_9HELI|nr:hypothetical protein [Helicobacter jaachi]TLD96810.1 hypothetical protein LS71_004195 [Helicobacter jaachi]